MANTMTPAQQQAAAQAAAMEAVLARQKADAKNPKTGGPAPEMPVVGGTPNVSPADKAKYAAEIAKKMAANKPVPVVPPKPVVPPVQPKPVEPKPPKIVAPPPVFTPTFSPTEPQTPSHFYYKKGGAVRSKPQTKFASGGSVGGASRRGDGIAQRGKTKGRMC